MADETPAPDDGPPPDPFEAELVAYLDGELDAAAARNVEARLAKDPAARARADELKKSFDLLDYLPRSEPSPAFTSRTLDRLPAIKPTASGSAPAARQASASTSLPVPLDEEEPSASRTARPRRYLWAAGLVAAVSAFGALGYLSTAAARPFLFGPLDKTPGQEKIQVAPRVVDNLPLYAVADDVEFVVELAKPDLFGHDPAVSFDPTLKVPTADTLDKPAAKQHDLLTKAFFALPPGRQAEIEQLDRDLHTKEPREADRLLRALEAYAAWLERLPESERRGVMAAATPGLRLGLVRDIRERQWLDALPSAVRADPQLTARWRAADARRRERWAFAALKTPWPFDSESGRKGVVEFAQAVFKPDDSKRCRLSPDELAEYRRVLAAAERDGSWAMYGLLVYELAREHPYLPEPDSRKLLYTEPGELPDFYSRMISKKGGWRMRPTNFGKWPEFPLEIRDNPFTKMITSNAPPLGPARVAEFKEPVRTFATKDLFPSLAADEMRDLQRLEGRWPDYPQRFLQYAYKHDLSVPGVTLPGSPKKWDVTYGGRPGVRPAN